MTTWKGESETETRDRRAGADVATLATILPIDTEDFRWHEDALCAQVGGDEWFPEKGGSTRQAKTVCQACPVAQECLYALTHHERFGIWGGKSERERRALTNTGPRHGGEPTAAAAAKTRETVARLTAAGMTVAEMAAEIGVTTRTIHRARKANTLTPDAQAS